ncbi:hypothetical protein INR77_13765 [Erythrobacter sp. SCSIO 43205]|uniref:hypothetical protein n=1 Tax=Erythrobacter sp. SCSIO 43205 TaxID=2779361 RepID=UPI001CA7CE17|nr:hypothetical protein [Erythrobacter sp. SCSIO 43205]UAB77827.1 hypothetical protein INR77_13765 [Erythrobacter sp. SCSIO 43205]
MTFFKTISDTISRLPRLNSSGQKVCELQQKGDYYRGKQEWSKAAECYDGAVAIDGSFVHLWVQLGHMRKESGSADLARLAYEKAAELDESDADICLHLGHLLKNMQLVSEARKAFVECLKRDPYMHDAYQQLLHLGWCRKEILAFVPELGQIRDVARLEEDWLLFELFETVRQTNAIGRQARIRRSTYDQEGSS